MPLAYVRGIPINYEILGEHGTQRKGAKETERKR
jgi:hypothetical protein